jgi:hypothetical protein
MEGTFKSVKSEKVTDLGVRLEQCSVFLRA